MQRWQLKAARPGLQFDRHWLGKKGYKTWQVILIDINMMHPDKTVQSRFKSISRTLFVFICLIIQPQRTPNVVE
jgi:hypothetical protein